MMICVYQSNHGCLVAQQPLPRPSNIIILNIVFYTKQIIPSIMATLRADFTPTNKEISQLQLIFLCNAVKIVLSGEQGRGFAQPHLHDEKVLLIFIIVKSQ